MESMRYRAGRKNIPKRLDSMLAPGFVNSVYSLQTGCWISSFGDADK